MWIQSRGNEVEGPEFGEGSRGDFGGGACQQAPELFGGVGFEMKAVLEGVVDGLDPVTKGGNEGARSVGPGGRRPLPLAGRQQQVHVEGLGPVARPSRR